MKTQNQKVRSKIKLLKKFLRTNRNFDGFISIPDNKRYLLNKINKKKNLERKLLCSCAGDFYYHGECERNNIGIADIGFLLRNNKVLPYLTEYLHKRKCINENIEGIFKMKIFGHRKDCLLYMWKCGYRDKLMGLCVYADDVESVKYAQECFDSKTSSL